MSIALREDARLEHVISSWLRLPEHVRESLAALAETIAAAHASDSAVLPPSGWLTARSAAVYLDFRGADPVNAFRKFARRQGIACAYRGDRPLYRRSDLDKAIGAAHRRTS
jgi:hypothetical protein